MTGITISSTATNLPDYVVLCPSIVYGLSFDPIEDGRGNLVFWRRAKVPQRGEKTYPAVKAPYEAPAIYGRGKVDQPCKSV